MFYLSSDIFVLLILQFDWLIVFVDPTQLQIFKSLFIFLSAVLASQKSQLLMQLSVFIHAKKFTDHFFFQSISVCQKSSWCINFFYSWFKEFCNLIDMENFWPHPAKNLQTNFYFYRIFNYHIHSSLSSYDTAALRILKSDCRRPFLTMTNLKFSNHLLRFLNLYMCAKKQVDSSVLPWSKVDSRTLQSDWHRASLISRN